eukprot:891974-Lingulodinium_polyedra.AAC.1
MHGHIHCKAGSKTVLPGLKQFLIKAAAVDAQWKAAQHCSRGPVAVLTVGSMYGRICVFNE